MLILMWIATAWLVSSATMMLLFYGTRYSGRLTGFLFGHPASDNVHRIEPVRAERERREDDRLAA